MSLAPHMHSKESISRVLYVLFLLGGALHCSVSALPVGLSPIAQLYANGSMSCGVALSLGGALNGGTALPDNLVFTVLGAYANTSGSIPNTNWAISVWYRATAVASLTLRGYVLDPQCQNGFTVSPDLYRYDCPITSALRIFIINGSNIANYYAAIQPTTTSNVSFTVAQQNIANSSTPYAEVCRWPTGGTTSTFQFNETIVAFIRNVPPTSITNNTPTVPISDNTTLQPGTLGSIIGVTVVCSLMLIVSFVFVGVRIVRWYRNRQYRLHIADKERTNPNLNLDDTDIGIKDVQLTQFTHSNDKTTPIDESSSNSDNDTSPLVAVNLPSSDTSAPDGDKKEQ